MQGQTAPLFFTSPPALRAETLAPQALVIDHQDADHGHCHQDDCDHSDHDDNRTYAMIITNMIRAFSVLTILITVPKR